MVMPASDGPMMPSNADAERDVITAILSPTGSAWAILARVQEVVPRPTMFYHPVYRLIYEAALEAFAQKGLSDALTVGEVLDREGRLGGVGGVEQLQALAMSPFGRGDMVPDRVLERAHVVQTCAVLRDCITAGQQILGIGWQGPRSGTDPAAIMAEVEAVVRQLSTAYVPETAVMVGDVLAQVLDEATGRIRPRGLGFGLQGVDRLISMQPGDLVLVAGRPGVGKTSLVCGLANYQAVIRQEPTLFNTGETTAAQAVKRLLSLQTGVPLTKLMAGEVREEVQWLEEARDKMREAPLLIDGVSQVTITGLASKVRRAAVVNGTTLVIVDGFQRIRGDPAENSRTLKDLAMQVAAVVVVTSQISQAVEHREGGPVLADLGEEVPALEQDADIVLLLHRRRDRPGEAEARVVKNRLGPTETVPLRFEVQPARYVDAEATV